jgi:hypothetical protein
MPLVFVVLKKCAVYYFNIQYHEELDVKFLLLSSDFNKFECVDRFYQNFPKSNFIETSQQLLSCYMLTDRHGEANKSIFSVF